MNMATLNNLTVRPVQMSDATPLKKSCWDERPLPDIEEFLYRCLRMAEFGRASMLVAEVEGQVIGFGMLSQLGKRAEISDLIVQPRWRNQGIGTLLIQRLLVSAQQMPINTVEIGVAQRNSRALALYQRLGFTPFQTLELDIGEGLETIVYLVMPVVR